jgi:UDP-N-acetylglucosamine enolpyruvyl transferase
MESFVIEGGRTLSGRVRASGNKNGALPILAASVLASDEVRLTNVPRIQDVETMAELLADIGASVEWTGPNEVRVDPAGVTKTDLDPELCREIRASFLLAGPLLARFGRVTVPPPGGDVIGRRRLDTHVHAFTALGAEFALDGIYELTTRSLVGTRVYLDEASVMGTENAIMAAVLAEGETILGHAACEPHIQDLCRFLVSLHIEDDLGRQVPKIESGIWPAFPADLTSIAVTVATQATGTILIFEKMFESRLFFVDKLVSMGARIILCDPHRVVVTGPATLYGERLESPDIRAGMAMVLAALCAEGESTIGNIRQIDRGYERIDERLQSLGASIQRADL